MIFKRGDVVIKKEGGNKMIVFNIDEFDTYTSESFVTCIWATEITRTEIFLSDQLMHFKDYQAELMKQSRADQLKKILEN